MYQITWIMDYYSEPSLQRQHLFPKMLPLKWIWCYTEYLMGRLIWKKGLFLFLFPQRTYVLDICKNCLNEAILTNIQNICFFKALNTIFLHNMWLLLLPKRTFCDSQIGIITNFVLVLSASIKRVVCTTYYAFLCIIYITHRSDSSQVCALIWLYSSHNLPWLDFLHDRHLLFFIALDKVLFSTKKYLYFFLFLNKNICCGYSLEVPQRGTSNEYPQHMFSSRNK